MRRYVLDVLWAVRLSEVLCEAEDGDVILVVNEHAKMYGQIAAERMNKRITFEVHAPLAEEKKGPSFHGF